MAERVAVRWRTVTSRLPLHRGPWPREATLLASTVAGLTLLGLVMSFSASFVDAAQDGDPFAVFRRQLLWASLGAVGYLAAAGVHHRVWRVVAWPLLAVALAGLVAVLIPGIGVVEGGARRWIDLGPVTVQPSEVAKLAVLLWLADVGARKRALGIDYRRQPAHAFIPALPLLGVVAVLILLEPDLGTTALVALTVGVVLLADGAPIRHLASLGLVGIAGVALAAVAAPYRLARIAGWLDPEADPLGTGYQLLQSLYALGSGGLFGVGLGASRSKWNFVPNPETDFIFAIIGEELGLVGSLLVLLAFAVLLIVGVRVARTARDHFGATVALAITATVTGQALINIAAVTGLLPITGVTLPLVSVGGSSLVATLVALGILTSIARDRP